jgi:hypothetical protein
MAARRAGGRGRPDEDSVSRTIAGAAIVALRLSGNALPNEEARGSTASEGRIS